LIVPGTPNKRISTIVKADISQLVGAPGETNHPKVRGMEDLIIRKALEYDKQPLVMTGNRNRIKELLSMGVKAFRVGSDSNIIFNAFKDTVRELKGK
jgi:2-keto-3-deoxy-L-rhamnonate aldolase RhmA